MKIDTVNSNSQIMLEFTHIASLPGGEGWAGMYAGVSNGMLFCFGGVNFPDKRPWEGGQKKWYDTIYMLQEGKDWVELREKLPCPLGYGVSITYNEKIIIIGGNNETFYSDKVFEYEWNGQILDFKCYPDLPVPLAHMAGTLVNNLVIIAGGNTSSAGRAVKKCYILDLEHIDEGWSELPSWPGRERVLPVCASHNGKFYLFGGETVELNALKMNYRHILNDAYSLTPYKSTGQWTCLWRSLSMIPKGLSAGGSPLPVLENSKIVFWGGVDALTALHTDPKTHPGISQDILLYSISNDSWEYAGREEGIAARVTLPVVYWNGHWTYIGGEVKPGFRSNAIYKISNNKNNSWSIHK